jgi:glycosyltransferase involved in cell wall biosynthesis
METGFWIAVFFACYSYLVYPLSLTLMHLFVRNPVCRRQGYAPAITFIITAHNEARRMRAKLDNAVALDYPHDKLQILVASDGSTDETNAIVSDYANRGVELLALDVRGGKEHAQARAVERSRGEVLVFSDVATMLDTGGLRQIASNFADKSIGCVSSVDSLIDPSGGGESVYVRYEMWLRGLESAIHSVVGLSGSFFAARREVCQDFSTVMPSDFRTLLNTIKAGMRGYSDAHAVGYYQPLKDESREFERKVRTVLRGITTFFHHPEFCNVFRYGLFAYQYCSHKLMRWLTPLFLATALIFNAVAALSSNLYAVILIVHLLAYALAIAGFALPAAARSPVIRIPKYFLIVNASVMVAWVKFLGGRRQVLWNPSIR